MEPQYELVPFDLFYELVDQFGEHGADFVRSRLENEFDSETLYGLSGFGNSTFSPSQSVSGQIEHIIKTIRTHSELNKDPICLVCGEDSHTINSCCDPIIEETWLELLEEVNPGDLEDVDLDSVRAMLENEVGCHIIVAISIQYGNGHFMEKLSVHTNRIIVAIKKFIEESGFYNQYELFESSTRCSVHLNERVAIENTFCQECPICYNEDLKTCQMVTLGCKHSFCQPCLVKHIEKNALKCPMCREPINQIITKQREDYEAVCAVLTARTTNNEDDTDSMPDLVSVDSDEDNIPEMIDIIPNNIFSANYNHPPNLIINNYDLYININNHLDNV